VAAVEATEPAGNGARLWAAGSTSVTNGPPSRLVLEIGVGQRLPVVIADDEAGVRLLGRPGRREVIAHTACGPSPLLIRA
jgi:hypothetical protein